METECGSFECIMFINSLFLILMNIFYYVFLRNITCFEVNVNVIHANIQWLNTFVRGNRFEEQFISAHLKGNESFASKPKLRVINSSFFLEESVWICTVKFSSFRNYIRILNILNSKNKKVNTEHSNKL